MNRSMFSGSLPIAACMLALLVGACQKKTESSQSSDTRAIDSTQLAPPAPPSAPAAASAVDTTGPVVTDQAVLSTSMGNIVIDLYGKDAPETVKNFVALAGKKYYDGMMIHRAVPGFMIQMGDPNSRNPDNRDSWGIGGESSFGHTFADELDPTTPSYRRGYVTGTVAMANRGPNTNGSQFFIVLTTAGAAHLPHNYTIFGAVREGMDVVTQIGETGRQGEKPEHPAALKSVKVAVASKDSTAASIK